MKASPKAEKAYRVQGDRTTQEQIRKRRHNLFKRLKEFNDRYEIEIWLTMRMPSGRIYIFATDPNEPVPTDENTVSSKCVHIWIISLIADQREHKVPVIHKTPADYVGKSKPPSAGPLQDPPTLPFLDLPFCVAKSDTLRPEWDRGISLAKSRADRCTNGSGWEGESVHKDDYLQRSSKSASPLMAHEMILGPIAEPLAR